MTLSFQTVKQSLSHELIAEWKVGNVFLSFGNQVEFTKTNTIRHVLADKVCDGGYIPWWVVFVKENDSNLVFTL